MAMANDRLLKIGAGKGQFTDDEPFVVAGAAQMRFYNKLFPQDLSLLAHTKKAWPVIKADGSIKKEVVKSVRAPLASLVVLNAQQHLSTQQSGDFSAHAPLQRMMISV